MAETLAVVGVVASIVQLIDFGTKVVLRMNEFHSAMGEVPKSFRTLEIELPLVFKTLKRIKEHAAIDDVEESSSLCSVVDGCLGEIERLDKILNKVSPSQGQSKRWRTTGLKAFKSFGYDKEVQRISTKLHGYMGILNLVQSTNNVDIGRTLVERGKSAPPELSPGLQRPVVAIPFHRNGAFVARQDILDDIGTQLDTGNRNAALIGIGGVGKSQIAIEFCYRYKEEHPEAHILWVHGGSPDRFDQAYSELALRLQIPRGDGPKIESRTHLAEWLSDATHGEWLMVLDNADDEDTVFGNKKHQTLNPRDGEPIKPLVDYIPRSPHGSVLVTSRDRRIGLRLVDYRRVIEVSPFGLEDAKQLLKTKLPEKTSISEEDSTELVKELHCLPLAITQAAAYINEEDVSLAHYVELLQSGDQQTSELLETSYFDAARGFNSQNSIFTTWKITFDQIRKRNPRAADILSLMAVLDRQAIPSILIRSSADSQVTHDRAVGMLKAFSLITEEKQEATFAMHRLVQLSTQRWLELRKRLIDWKRMALVVVASRCPSRVVYKDWKRWDQVSPHAYIVSHYDFEDEGDSLLCARIMMGIVAYSSLKGQYDRAATLVEESLAICDKVLGQDHKFTFNSRDTLADVLSIQGYYDQSHKIHQESLRILENTLALDHPRILRAKFLLFKSMIEQKSYDEAEELLRPLLVTAIEKLGRKDSLTLAVMDLLATALAQKQENEEANMLRENIMSLRLEIHGPAEKNMSANAKILIEMRRYGDAEGIYRDLLDVYIKTLGERHPDSVTIMSSLAYVLGCQQKYEEADQLYLRYFMLSKEVYGECNPIVFFYLYLYAIFLEEQHRYDEAAKYYGEANGFCTTAGEEHPKTVEVQDALTRVLRLKQQSLDNDGQESEDKEDLWETDPSSSMHERMEELPCEEA